MNSSADSNALLRELVAEVHALRADMRELLQPRVLPTRADLDRQWLAALLPHLSMVSFTARSALDRGSTDTRLGALLAGHNAMSLGRKLCSMTGIVIDDRVLIRRGQHRGAAVYSVRTTRTCDGQALRERTADFLRKVRTDVGEIV